MSQTEAVEQITKDTTIGEIVEKYPEVIETLLSYGVHCVGCHVSGYESLEDGFRGHGLEDEEIESAVVKLNEIIVKKPKSSAISVTEDSLADATMHISSKAAQKIKDILQQEKKQALRVTVHPGGCSGYKYEIVLDNATTAQDVVIEQQDVKVFIDKSSLAKLNGATIDYVDGLQGAGFKIKNPNATASCGCGSSFR